MSSFRTARRAYDVHSSIPKWMRSSAASPVWSWSASAPAIPSMLNGGALQRVDLCRDQIERATRPGGLTPMGVVIGAVLSEGALLSNQYQEILDHESLETTLAVGQVPVGTPESPDAIPLDVARQHAEHLRYIINLAEAPSVEEDEGRAKAFAATHHLMKRRLAPLAVWLGSRFIVPDPLQVEKTACVLDELVVARDENYPDRLRRIALIVGPDLAGSAKERERDRRLADMHYEIFHASMSWARVDPVRTIRCWFRRAGLPILDEFQVFEPGKTIDDYRCHVCRAPLLRTPTGEGIVEYRDHPLHEGRCRGRAVDTGFFEPC